MRRLTLSLLLAVAATAVRADDGWPIQGGFDVKSLLASPPGQQLRKAMAAEYDKAIADASKETGFKLDTIVFATGGYGKVVGPQSFGRPPLVCVELPDADAVTAAVAARKMTEVKAKGTIPGAPNAVAYKPTGSGPGYVVDGAMILVVEMDPDVADIGGAFKNHATVKAAMAKAACHQYLRVDGAVMNMVKQFPMPPEADSFKPLLNATEVTWAASVSTKLAIDLRGQFVNAKDADDAKEALDQAMALAGVGLNVLKGQMEKDKGAPKGMKELFDGLQALRKSAKPKVEGTTVVVKAEALLPENIGAIVGEAVGKTGEAAGRAQSQNNLKQLGLAVHSYHDAMGTMPANTYSKDEKPKALLSWRVHLLPYIEQDALYREFKLDESWDSDANKKLIAKMPKTFAHPKAKAAEAGMTHYRSFAPAKKGETKCIFPAFPGEKWSITGITDGLSNTIMIAEAADPVVWTKPDALVVAEDGKLPRLGGVFPGGFNVLFGDGSVRFVKDTIDPKTLKALITANGGEVTRIDD